MPAKAAAYSRPPNARAGAQPPADRGARARRGVLACIGLPARLYRPMPASSAPRSSKMSWGQHGKLAFAGRAAVGGGPVQPDAAGGRRRRGQAPGPAARRSCRPGYPRCRPAPDPGCRCRCAKACRPVRRSRCRCPSAPARSGAGRRTARRRPAGRPATWATVRPVRRAISPGWGVSTVFSGRARAGPRRRPSAFSASASSTQAFQAELPPSSACSTAPAPAPSPGPASSTARPGANCPAAACASPGSRQPSAPARQGSTQHSGQRASASCMALAAPWPKTPAPRRCAARPRPPARRAQVAPAAGKGRHRAVAALVAVRRPAGQAGKQGFLGDRFHNRALLAQKTLHFTAVCIIVVPEGGAAGPPSTGIW